MTLTEDFVDFADKMVAIGRAMNVKGGREAVAYMMAKKGSATRGELIGATGMSKSNATVVVEALKSGGLLDAPDQRGAILVLHPGVKAAMSAMAKAALPEGVTAIAHGGMVAKFTKLPTKDDPVIEGSCGPYKFTAILGDPGTGAWETGAEHFVIRDQATGKPIAKHDPELGWTKRPWASTKQQAHLELIERLFLAAPKM